VKLGVPDLENIDSGTRHAATATRVVALHSGLSAFPSDIDPVQLLIAFWGCRTLLGLTVERIKSLCGAKPPQKLRWTNARRWSAIGAMQISPRTLGVRAENGGSAYASCVV